MILEGIVTTVSPEGVLNVAPMGPHVGPGMERFVLRPFPTAQTYRNLRAHGSVLRDACRYYEFRIRSLDESEPRVRIEAEVVHAGRLRDFFGFNRAKHAVVEAAILATRTDFLPLDEVEAEYRKLAVIVDKTGGEQERRAFAFLCEHVRRVARE